MTTTGAALREERAELERRRTWLRAANRLTDRETLLLRECDDRLQEIGRLLGAAHSWSETIRDLHEGIDDDLTRLLDKCEELEEAKPGERTVEVLCQDGSYRPAQRWAVEQDRDDLLFKLRGNLKYLAETAYPKLIAAFDERLAKQPADAQPVAAMAAE